MLVRNAKGRVIRIEEILGKRGKAGGSEPIVCSEGASNIPDGIRDALVHDWPDEVREQAKAKLEELHEACGKSVTIH